MRAPSLLLALGSAAWVAGCGGVSGADRDLVLWPGDSYAFECAQLGTPGHLDALAHTAAVRSGAAPPACCRITDWCRRSVENTGEVVPGTRERIFALRIEDDPADLAQVHVRVDGRLVGVATRAKDIVVEAGVARASLHFTLPPEGVAFSYAIETIGEDGEVDACEGSVPGLLRPWADFLGWISR